MKFTDNRIKNLKPSLSGRKDCFLFDDETPHLGVRVSAKSKRFVFQARLEGGGQYRKTLGVFPALTVDEARRVTKVLTGKLAGGADLREERAAKQVKRDQARADAALTLGRLIDQWEAAHKPKRRSNYVKGTANGLRRAYARLLDQPANSIRAEEIEKGWESLTSQPAAAHMAGVRMRTLFRWAVKTRKLDGDPTKQVVLAEKTQSRDRELNDDEARAVWKAAGTLPAPYGAFVRFLMATGVRIREAAETSWREFDIDFSKWTIPSTRMKVKLKHVVPLPPILRKMLAGLPRFAASDLVFTRDGKRAVTGFSDLKQRLDEALIGQNLSPWTFHDFRRSVVGWLVRNGFDSLVADKLLAHTRTSKLNAVAAVYNHYDFLKERATALERWVDFLVVEEVGTSASAPRMLPAPDLEPIDARPDATSPVVILGDFSQAMARKDEVAARFVAKITDILTNPDVMHANEQILKAKLSTAFREKHRDKPYKAAFLTLAYSAAERALNDETVLKRNEVEMQRNVWDVKIYKLRSDAKRARAEAEVARAMGREEFACEADARAQEFDAQASHWEQMLQAFITTDDPRCVEYRAAEASHASSVAKGVALALRPCMEEIFGSEHGTWAATYATAAVGWEVSRYQGGRRRLKAQAISPKRAAC